jgi:hypothetical protein
MRLPSHSSIDPGAMRSAGDYNLTQFLEQRRDMSGKWPEHLDWLRGGAQLTTRLPRVA